MYIFIDVRVRICGHTYSIIRVCVVDGVIDYRLVWKLEVGLGYWG